MSHARPVKAGGQASSRHARFQLCGNSVGAAFDTAPNTGLVPMNPRLACPIRPQMTLACYHRLAKTCRRGIRGDTARSLGFGHRVQFDRLFVKCYKTAFCMPPCTQSSKCWIPGFG